MYSESSWGHIPERTDLHWRLLVFKGRFSRDILVQPPPLLVLSLWPCEWHRDRVAQTSFMESVVLAENELWGYNISTRIQLFVTKSVSPNKHWPAFSFTRHLFPVFTLPFITLFQFPSTCMPPKTTNVKKDHVWLSALLCEVVILLEGMGEGSPRTLKGHSDGRLQCGLPLGD